MHGLEPQQCLFFGDTIHDWQASQTNKIPFIGVDIHGKSSLKALGGKVCLIKNFIDIAHNQNQLVEFIERNKKTVCYMAPGEVDKK